MSERLRGVIGRARKVLDRPPSATPSAIAGNDTLASATGCAVHGFIDRAALVGGCVVVEGWALVGDELPMALVVSAGGRSVPALIGFDRPDIPDWLASSSAATNAGWRAELPLGFVASPAITATVMTRSGSHDLPAFEYQVSAASSLLVVDLPEGYLDRPRHGDRVGVGPVVIAGWCATGGGPASVVVTVDGTVVEVTRHGRGDVGCGDSGFEASVALSPGPHEIEVRGRSISGQWALIAGGVVNANAGQYDDTVSAHLAVDGGDRLVAPRPELLRVRGAISFGGFPSHSAIALDSSNRKHDFTLGLEQERSPVASGVELWYRPTSPERARRRVELDVEAIGPQGALWTGTVVADLEASSDGSQPCAGFVVNRATAPRMERKSQAPTLLLIVPSLRISRWAVHMMRVVQTLARHAGFRVALCAPDLNALSAEERECFGAGVMTIARRRPAVRQIDPDYYEATMREFEGVAHATGASSALVVGARSWPAVDALAGTLGLPVAWAIPNLAERDRLGHLRGLAADLSSRAAGLAQIVLVGAHLDDSVAESFGERGAQVVRWPTSGVSASRVGAVVADRRPAPDRVVLVGGESLAAARRAVHAIGLATELRFKATVHHADAAARELADRWLLRRPELRDRIGFAGPQRSVDADVARAALVASAEPGPHPDLAVAAAAGIDTCAELDPLRLAAALDRAGEVAGQPPPVESVYTIDDEAAALASTGFVV